MSLRREPKMHLRHACGVVMLGATLIAPAGARASVSAADFVGVWAFDGRQTCNGGPAWILAADGTYAEAMLPDLRPHAWGLWREKDGMLFYTPAQLAPPSPAAPMHPLKVIERTSERIVAVTHDRVRRVMHYCGRPKPAPARQ